MPRVNPGSQFPTLTLSDIYSRLVTIPTEGKWTHLQFRRFAGCPLCNLHLQSFIANALELESANIQEVVVFHSTQDQLKKESTENHLYFIADPEKHLYKRFGVETSAMSVMHPAAWIPAMKGVVTKGMRLPQKAESMIGLPADFLIDPNGIVKAAFYGSHAYDQWEFNEVISLTKEQPLSKAG